MSTAEGTPAKGKKSRPATSPSKKTAIAMSNSFTADQIAKS